MLVRSAEVLFCGIFCLCTACLLIVYPDPDLFICILHVFLTVLSYSSQRMFAFSRSERLSFNSSFATTEKLWPVVLLQLLQS